MKRKPYIIGIKETYIKQVLVFADTEQAAQETAEELCDHCVIDVKPEDFVTRTTECYGQANLPLDMQIYEAYGSRMHISEVKKGNILIHEGQLYTASADARLCSREEGEDWCIPLDGDLPDMYVYGSYFPEGMVDIAQPMAEQALSLGKIIGNAQSRSTQPEKPPSPDVPER